MVVAPGPPDLVRLLENDEIHDPRFAQLDGHAKPPEAGSDDDDVEVWVRARGLVHDGRACKKQGKRVARRDGRRSDSAMRKLCPGFAIHPERRRLSSRPSRRPIRSMRRMRLCDARGGIEPDEAIH